MIFYINDFVLNTKKKMQGVEIYRVRILNSGFILVLFSDLLFNCPDVSPTIEQVDQSFGATRKTAIYRTIITYRINLSMNSDDCWTGQLPSTELNIITAKISIARGKGGGRFSAFLSLREKMDLNLQDFQMIIDNNLMIIGFKNHNMEWEKGFFSKIR